MNINEVNESEYVDIFATNPKQEAAADDINKIPKFGAEDDPNKVNLFDNTNPDKKEDEKKEGEEDDKKEEEDNDPNKEVDLLGTGENKPGRKPKYAFEDAVGYFEDRFKSGKFAKITVENDKGEVVPFIPKTPEEFDEVIDLQVNHRFEKATKELEAKWYQSKPPAWQAVAKYAEMVETPAELIPFIQGVQTIESVTNINEDEIDGAERIVRVRLAQRGDSEDIIDEQIELLKTSDKLVSTAKKYKPLIIKAEQSQLLEMNRAAEQQKLEFNQLVTSIRTKAVEAIEAPIFGKQKLKNDEKSVIFDLIAQPNAEAGGYKIYNVIDTLFQNGDFETLKLISLIAGGKKDAVIGYISADAKNVTAAGLQNKLRIASDSKESSGKLDAEEEVRIHKPKYVSQPKFGRG